MAAGVPVELLSPSGSSFKPNFIEVDRAIHRCYDKILKCNVFEAQESGDDLVFLRGAGLAHPHPILVLQMSSIDKFHLEICIFSEDKRRYRLYVSSIFSRPDVSPLHAKLPCHWPAGRPRLAHGWIQLIIDVESICSSLPPPHALVFARLDSLSLKFGGRARRVFLLPRSSRREKDKCGSDVLVPAAFSFPCDDLLIASPHDYCPAAGNETVDIKSNLRLLRKLRREPPSQGGQVIVDEPEETPPKKSFSFQNIPAALYTSLSVSQKLDLYRQSMSAPAERDPPTLATDEDFLTERRRRVWAALAVSSPPVELVDAVDTLVQQESHFVDEYGLEVFLDQLGDSLPVAEDSDSEE